MIILTKEHIVHLHDILLDSYGGLGGIRDEGLLVSALSSAFHTFDNVELYPTLVDKIVRIAYGLITNHPFFDGNKRIGTYVMLILFEMNDIKIDINNDDIINIGLNIANGNLSETQLLNVVLSHLKQ